MTQRKIPEPKPLFIERMQALLNPADFKEYQEMLKIPPVRSIRCNTLRISPEKLKERLEKNGWKIKQPWHKYPKIMIVEGKYVAKKEIEDKEKDNILNNQFNNSENILDDDVNNKSIPSEARLILGGGVGKNIKNKNKLLIDLEPGELGRALEHQLGYYYVQELSSMLPVLALEPRPEETILDLCASPGSKTTQIASSMKNTGAIIANEVSLARIKILASNLERCGVTNTIITKKEGSALCLRLEKSNLSFDKILVDAPCSGEGTLRSSHKTYLMWNIKTIKALPRIQKSLLRSAIDILKIGGTIIYSTCTHAPEENEEVVSNILNEFGNSIKLEEIKLPIKPREGITNWEDKTYNSQVKKCARIYPQDNNTEGFFLAKIKKVRWKNI